MNMKLVFVTLFLFWVGCSVSINRKDRRTNPYDPNSMSIPAIPAKKQSKVTNASPSPPISIRNDSWTKQFINTTYPPGFEDYVQSFNQIYDRMHPVVANQTLPASDRLTPFKAMLKRKSARCIAADDMTKSKDLSLNQRHLYELDRLSEYSLITTPCLEQDSLGNSLSFYFESLLCSYFARLHFITAAFTWNPNSTATAATISSFFKSLPRAIPHPDPVTNNLTAEQNLNRYCRCTSLCHEKPKALWVNGLFLIVPILSRVFRQLYHEVITTRINRNLITIDTHETNATNLFYFPPNVDTTDLPLIPDVAIHYRCGDNFVSPYGFLPFRTFITLLNDSYVEGKIQTIYVLAESPHRVGNYKHFQMQMCDQIFPHLLHVLSQAFPRTTILIRRGDEMNLDLVRLAYAKMMTICSVSTFCLWPALVQGKKALFPRTPLVVGGNLNIDLGFQWLTDPSIVPGLPYAYGPLDRLLQALYEGLDQSMRKTS